VEISTNNLGSVPVTTLKMLELASFVLDIGNDFSKVRELGWEFILLLPLWYHKDTQLSEKEITGKTKEIFGFANIPPFIVKETLRRLLEKKDISIEQEKRYKLTTKGISRIAKILDKHSEVKSKEIDIVKHCLYGFLGGVFERWGSVGAKLLLTYSMDKSIPRCEMILDSAVSDIRDENLKEVIKLTIKQFLERASKEEAIARHISSIAQTYYLIQILNLDPELKKLQKESLANVTVF